MIRNPIDVATRVSPHLSVLIENRINRSDDDQYITLETIHEFVTMNSGLSASLVGAGVLEEDEDDVLLEEIDALIDRHGADALAEEFIRYE